MAKEIKTDKASTKADFIKTMKTTYSSLNTSQKASKAAEFAQLRLEEEIEALENQETNAENSAAAYAAWKAERIADIKSAGLRGDGSQADFTALMNIPEVFGNHYAAAAEHEYSVAADKLQRFIQLWLLYSKKYKELNNE